MTFKEAMEHYRAGTASDEERQLVEQELEKSRLIAEYLDEQWEAEVPVQPAPQEEMEQVRKNLRARNAMIVLTSLVLAAALFLGIVYLGIPAAESLYWDPTVTSYGNPQQTDTELMFAAYTELFCPDINLSNVTVSKSGFAKYDLNIQYWNNHQGGDTHFASGTIERGDLTLPTGLLRYCPINIFERSTYPFFPAEEDHLQQMHDRLSALPPYVTLVAAVSFPEDKSMAEVLAFNDGLVDGHVGWTAIRNGPLNIQTYPLCGMNIYQWGTLREDLNTFYPCFDIKSMDKTPENLEAHFKALLQFSADQIANGTGIAPARAEGMEGYFRDVLNYVEANGIYSYGCYVRGTPETFLALIDSGAVSQVWIEDIWINP